MTTSYITNAGLAQQVSDLLAKWQTRETQMQAWIGGTATGGPFANGTYPLTDVLGNTANTPSPAALVSGVGVSVTAATAQAVLAAASATAAAASASAASTSATAAATSAAAASTSATAAGVHDTNTASLQALAQTSANAALASQLAAAVSAAAALVSQTASAGSATAAAASATAAAASAVLAATFNPALFAALAGAAFTGTVTFGGVAATNAALFTSGTVGTARLGSGTASSSTWLRGDQTWGTLPATVSAANPSATIGLSANNGTAATFMRSDATPALGVAISPTWTGNHVFNPAAGSAIDINGVAGAEVLVINSNSGGSAVADIFVGRTASIINSLAAGPALQLSDTGGNTHSIWQQSGGQTELWQFNGSWNQILKATTARGLIFNSPSSGVGVAVNGVAGSIFVAQALQVTSPNTASNSNGVRIFAGTNTADSQLILTNAANTVNHWVFDGAGALFSSGLTSGGAGSINITGAIGCGVQADSQLFVLGPSGCSLRIDYSGLAGNNYYDATQHNFRSTAGSVWYTLAAAAATFSVPVLAPNLPATVVCASNETRISNTVMSNSSQLTAPIAAAGKYAVKIVMYLFGAGGASVGVNYSGTFTPAASLLCGMNAPSGTSVANVNAEITATSGGTTTPLIQQSTSGTNAIPQFVMFEGTLTATGAGTLSVAYAQFSSNATASTLGVGSYMQITKIA